LCRLPLYYELKLAYIVALWHPQTKFALTVYGKVLLPFLQHHEPQIDRSFLELKTKAMDHVGSGAQQ
jgi:receptor expression-enhancing protein 1/2/3/4